MKKNAGFDSNVNNYNKTKELHVLNTFRNNKTIPIFASLKDTQFVKSSQKTRFPRNVKKSTYKSKKENTSGQNLKVILDLQSENEEDRYDYYNTDNYYGDYQEKNTNGLVDDWSLIFEMDKNSRPITRTLSESQERKRCVKECTQIIKAGKDQQFQNLFQGNIEDERKLKSADKDFQFSKPNTTIPEELNKSKKNTLRLKQIDDDYFINILKQLIDKLNKSKLKSSNNRDKDILALKNNELDQTTIEENKTVNEKITNSSSEEEWILKFEKMKGNRIRDRLNSSPENTFINGNWVRNKIIKNKSNDCKSLVNDIGIEISDKNESIAKSDIKPSNLLLPENQVTEVDVEMSKTLNNFQTVSTQENIEISTSPKPEKNGHPLEPRETIKPLSSTTKDNLESTITDENDNNQEKTIEPTINNFQTSSTIGSNEESTSDPNILLKLKKPVGTSQADEKKNQPKINNLEGVTNIADSSSKEKENNSLESNVNYNCDKKVVKQILSSIIIKNITEIKTNTIPSKNQKVNVLNKRSNQSQKSNGEINSSKTNLEELNENSFNKSMKIIINKQSQNDTYYNTNKNMNNVFKKSSSKDIHPELNLKQFKLNNQKKKNNNISEVNNKRVNLTPIHKDLKKSVTNLKKNIQIKNDTNLGNNFVKYKNKLIENNKIYTTLKIPSIVLTKSISQISSRNKPEESIKHVKYRDIISDSNQKKAITKLNHDVPVYSKTYYSKRNSSIKNTNDDSIVKKDSLTSKNLSQASMKIINKPLSTIKSRPLGQIIEHDNDIKNEGLRTVDDKLKYKPPLNTTGKKDPLNMHINQKQISLKDSEDNNYDLVSIKLRKLPSLVKHIDDTKNQMIPTKTHEYIDLTKSPTIINKLTVRNKDASKPKIWKSTQLIQTPKMFTRLTGTTVPMENDEITSTLKLKKSLSDEEKKVSLVPLRVLEKKKPLTTLDLFDKSSSPLKKQNSIKGQSLTKAGLKSSLKFKNKPDPKLLLNFKPRTDYYDHTPYTNEDLKPIIFKESRKILPKTNSELSLQNPASWQTLFGNQLPNILGLKPLKSVPIIHPEYDDYYDTQKNSKSKQGLNISNYGPITLDYIEYDDENSKEKSLNRSRFEVLPPMKVAHGIFKIPLVGHTIYHKNGSEHMSDIFIPIEKSDGQHSALSLKELLTGDFDLLNGHDDRILDIKQKSETGSTFNSAWIPKDKTNFDVTENLFDPQTLMALRRSKENQETAPIHIMQIINNSLCPGNHNDTKDIKNSEYVSNDEVKFQQLRNEDKKMLTSRLRSSSNNKQINPKFENAYNHFDSEILDKFLQVYSPINTV